MRGGGSDTKGRTGSRLGWLLRFGVGALVVFIGANAFVVVAERRLPDPPRYLSPRTEQLAGEMDRLKEAGVRSDLLFAGTSQAARGVVPRVVGSALGLRWTGNVAIPGSQAPVTKRWLLEEVEPRLHPRCVVWGLSSIDFNGARPDPGVARYNAALATRQGLLGTADEILADNVAVAEHRSQLRDPYKLGKLLEEAKPSARPTRPLHALLGAVHKNGPTTARGKHTELLFLEHTLLANFRVTPDYLGAYRTTLEQLADRGVKTAVVIMPVSSTYKGAHPKGTAEYQAWKRLTVRTAEAAGARVIDLDSSMPDSAFSDYVHLTPDAASAWSATLAKKLASLDCGKSR
jgi:hypothetical protein